VLAAGLSGPPAQMSSVLAGGRPPAQLPICAGTRLLAGAIPASTDGIWPPAQIVTGLVIVMANRPTSSAFFLVVSLNEMERIVLHICALARMAGHMQDQAQLRLHPNPQRTWICGDI